MVLASFLLNQNWIFTPLNLIKIIKWPPLLYMTWLSIFKKRKRSLVTHSPSLCSLSSFHPTTPTTNTVPDFCVTTSGTSPRQRRPKLLYRPPFLPFFKWCVFCSSFHLWLFLHGLELLLCFCKFLLHNDSLTWIYHSKFVGL